jgi:hypothetical protein
MAYTYSDFTYASQIGDTTATAIYYLDFSSVQITANYQLADK